MKHNQLIKHKPKYTLLFAKALIKHGHFDMQLVLIEYNTPNVIVKYFFKTKDRKVQV